MARFDKFQVMAKIAAAPMVPVFYNKDAEVCKNVIKACYAGGVRAFEFTNRGDFAHEVFAELSKWAAVECPELVLGIGSVVDAPTAALYIPPTLSPRVSIRLAVGSTHCTQLLQWYLTA